MKNFLDDNFVLETPTAENLYHKYSKHLPIIDYHCHLDPKMIAEDYQFDNLGEIWLAGDHYKWRAMRANGIAEKYITGKETSDWEKYEKWAETIPYTMRNPLYHWTHLELKTAFGIDTILKPETAREIFEECTAKLKTKEYSARNLMKRYNVEAVCTTDDPTDSLEHHQALLNDGFEVKVLPTWRPDKLMAVENPQEFRQYVEKLAAVSGVSISNYADLLSALRKRHDYFASLGCKLSDHGMAHFFSDSYTDVEIKQIFEKIYSGKELTADEAGKFKSAILFEGAVMDWEKGWVQQFHFGVVRNNSSRLYKQYGPDAGCDSIADYSQALSMIRFFDRLDAIGKLTKTILYNLNPRDNDLIATMIGNYQDGSVAGKMQFGSGWWFLDQKDGMEAQMRSLSNQGLLSRFVGMLTDSRSFLSYPRHEYFRRILCNLLGNDVEKGFLPASEIEFIGKMAGDISYNNAKNFFNF